MPLVVSLFSTVIVSASLIQITVIYPNLNLWNTDVLTLRGTGIAGLSWDKGVALTQGTADKNQWTINLTAAAGDVGKQLQVKALINDKNWMQGSNEMATILASDMAFEFYPWFGSQKGTVHLLPDAFFSPQLKNSRQIAIYFPPSFTENNLKVYKDVLIMHDGNNLFTSNLCQGCCPFGCWNIAPTLDQYIAQGNIREVFVIGVFNTEDRMSEYTYSADPDYSSTPKGNLYLDFLEQTVLPYMTTRWRVAAAPSTLGILGSSLGGLISCYAGYTRPKVYTVTGCMSPSFWWNNEDFNSTILPVSGSVPSGIYWLDAGSAESQIAEATMTVRDHFVRLGKKLNTDLFFYLDPGAEHSEQYWGKRFWMPMVKMFPGSQTLNNFTA